MKNTIKNTIRMATIGMAAIIAAGCAQNAPQKVCEPGQSFNAEKKMCIINTPNLNAIVESVSCDITNKCSGIVNDNRGRKLRVPLDNDIKKGDIINIVLYKDKK